MIPERKEPPGPDAHGAFRLGMLAAAVCGLGALGFGYWLGLVTPIYAGYALLILFPVYLVFAASALSVWLGFDKDASDLRPVYREKESS